MRKATYSLVLFALLWAPIRGLHSQTKDLPREFEQILPRGGIPAVFSPKYVPASEAHINKDTYVLGVVINGQARAYSLNLLNHHEIVNDKIGNTAFAAVW